MRRVAVVTSTPPGAEGGHLVIARSLLTALREAGHRAGLILTPHHPFGRQASAYVATWFTDVSTIDGGPTDQVISIRYPSYAVRHRTHVCWLNHTMREYYDLWNRFTQQLGPVTLAKERIRRRAMHAADRYLLTKNVTRLFVQSHTIQRRLAGWPELRSAVLYPPAPPRAYRCDEYGDHILVVSRLTPLKRIDLVLRALAHPDGAGIRCVIAGAGEEQTSLRRLARELHVDDRVEMVGHVDDNGLVERLARCRAVCFPPYDEDYGFVTVEAFAARKPVITCTDSGGPTELVTDNIEGLVCDPTPESVARAMRRMMDEAGFAERLGAAAYARGAQLAWPQVVQQLLV